jgi:hypothetical protein
MTTPRALFQKLHPEAAKKLALAVNESWFQMAVTYTRSELSMQGVSVNGSLGSTSFGRVHRLADERSRRRSDKSSLPSYEHPGMTPPEETEKE